MTLVDLFEELLAISLIDRNECKKNYKMKQYLKELILDFYEKIGNNENDKENFDPIKEVYKIKCRIIKDSSLNIDQKMILYNNLENCKIGSRSQFKRIMMMEKR